MASNKENVIEFISGEKTSTVSFTNQKHINRIKKLYQDHRQDFGYLIENVDGSVCANVPLSWIKISPPRKVSEEQKLAASERFKKMHEEKSIIKQ
jgi:hypothetical protein